MSTEDAYKTRKEWQQGMYSFLWHSEDEDDFYMLTKHKMNDSVCIDFYGTARKKMTSIATGDKTYSKLTDQWIEL